MKPLDIIDLHYLRAAQGWFELGDDQAANTELEEITPEARVHPDVLDLRWAIYAKHLKWEACIEIASALVKLAPDRSDSWVHRSFALHAAGRTREALENLLAVTDKFPGVWEIPYNLACYNSVLGDFEEAQRWFKRAILIDDKAVQRAGIDDPDLKPLWDSMSTTIWLKNE
jgi:tetratricopeptide (TPR) repeat protein